MVVADLNEETAIATAAGIADASTRRTLPIKVDVTDEAQVEAMVSKILAEFGRLGHCGVKRRYSDCRRNHRISGGKMEGCDECQFVWLFSGSQTHRPPDEGPKKRRDHSNQFQIGQKGQFQEFGLCGQQIGGIGLTQSIALDLAEFGVRVNAVCPGNLLDSPLWVDSLYGQYAKKWGITEAEVRQKYIDQVPMKRGCTYEDVCNVVVFLASDQGRLY